MDLPSILLSRASEPRTGGIALSSALLAVPALVAGHPGAGVVLLAFSLIAGAAFLEWRTRAAPPSRELPRLGVALVPVPSRSRPAHAAPRARWELVERDGRRSLSMRWS
ncbi:MAG TPA: hypothetical protein VFO11_06555 [Candidatus Polarisedimenticolaceae bacterium]|nr:hypothetical protein [Candidatus Polarisedimenticolaceae bacterium]